MIRVHHRANVPIWALAGASLFWLAPPALAAAEDDLAGIRNEISKLRQDYEMKIKDLEERLQKAETDAQAARAAAAAAQTAPSAVAAAPSPPAPPSAPEPLPTPRAPASQNAFNPVIAAVLNGFIVGASRDPSAARIPGFQLGDEAGGPQRGFSIGESEVALSANIDPFLFGSLNLSFGNDNSLGVEEGYIQTIGLGGGLTLKAGRFFSGIGYINERHAHDWSFSDAPLPYRAFLNNQYGDDGIQARWLAPTNIFLEFGAEWYRGASFPAAGAANRGKGTATAFVHAGGDINQSSSWLAGLSYLHARAENRDFGGDIFTGDSNLGIASAVYKWAPNGNPVVRNLVVSGEYFFGNEDGAFNGIPVDRTHSGWYVQGVYQFVPRWSFGLRYARLRTGDVDPLLAGSTLDDLGRIPYAATALLEFDTSEFGRLRLQYSHDESDFKPLDEILFQYTVIYGPHGAHRY